MTTANGTLAGTHITPDGDLLVGESRQPATARV